MHKPKALLCVYLLFCSHPSYTCAHKGRLTRLREAVLGNDSTSRALKSHAPATRRHNTQPQDTHTNIRTNKPSASHAAHLLPVSYLSPQAHHRLHAHARSFRLLDWLLLMILNLRSKRPRSSDQKPHRRHSIPHARMEEKGPTRYRCWTVPWCTRPPQAESRPQLSTAELPLREATHLQATRAFGGAGGGEGVYYQR